MANEPKAINLLPGKDGGFFTQFLNWSLTIGRLLIILVETLALGTFLYRFNLDMQIVDLHDQIKAEGFIVENFVRQEDEFRNLQARLALAKTYDDANPAVTIFKDIAELGRGKVTFKSLFVTLDSVKIEASAPSSASLSQFTEALKAHPQVSEVNIDKVENKSTNATIIIVISAKLKTNPALTVPEVSIIPGAIPAGTTPPGVAQ
jgi:hypothetical protein